jgi:hypothetical protein
VGRAKHGPEYAIQADLIQFMRNRGWLVERMACGMFQIGIPDLYCYHTRYGERWIDAKNPEQYSFTKAQKQKWPLWAKYGVGIWILTAATEEQYALLFKAPNWRDYWKPSWKYPTEEEIDQLLDDIECEY